MPHTETATGTTGPHLATCCQPPPTANCHLLPISMRGGGFAPQWTQLLRGWVTTIPGTSRAISSRRGPRLGFGGVTPEVFEPAGESNGEKGFHRVEPGNPVYGIFAVACPFGGSCLHLHVARAMEMMMPRCKTISWKFRIACSTVPYHFGGKSPALSRIQFRFLFYIPIHDLKSKFHTCKIPSLWHMGYVRPGRVIHLHFQSVRTMCLNNKTLQDHLMCNGNGIP